MHSPNKVALVAGARGAIGRNLIAHLAALGDWDVIGLSRRGGESNGRVRHLAIDLLDRDACRGTLGSLGQITHVFYAAYQERPNWCRPTSPCWSTNINNGDLFRWNELWPRIARYFDLETAPPLPMSLATVMADKEPLWNAMVEQHGLARHPYKDLSSWPFGDFVFSWDYDLFADGSKARRFGFHEYVETEAMLLRIFDELRSRRIIPWAAAACRSGGFAPPLRTPLRDGPPRLRQHFLQREYAGRLRRSANAFRKHPAPG